MTPIAMRMLRCCSVTSRRPTGNGIEVAGQYYLHRFLRHQPDLNYDNPLVQEAMLDVVDFWIERGVDGFRLDAVPFLCEEEGTRCEGLPATHAFLKRLRERVDSHGRDVLLLGEAIQPVQEIAPYLISDELHGAFNFALTAHLFAAIASGAVEGLRSCLNEAQEAVHGCRWALPLRNHDELWLGDGHLVPEDVIQTIRAGPASRSGALAQLGDQSSISPVAQWRFRVQPGAACSAVQPSWHALPLLRR